jgi:Fanconi anemia group M protein
VPDVNVTIVADTGELRCRVPDALRALGVAVDMRSLPVADYLVGDDVGVERKTVADLHRSIANGRLWSQLLACRQELDRTYLLVEGSALDAGYISRAGIRGALLEVGDRGVTVVRAIDGNDSALWLVRIAARLRRGESRFSAPRRRPRTTTPFQLVSAVPGIGQRTAADLLGRFGSVRAIANADVAELKSVQGVGPRRASMLQRVLSGHV